MLFTTPGISERLALLIAKYSLVVCQPDSSNAMGYGASRKTRRQAKFGHFEVRGTCLNQIHPSASAG